MLFVFFTNSSFSGSVSRSAVYNSESSLLCCVLIESNFSLSCCLFWSLSFQAQWRSSVHICSKNSLYWSHVHKTITWRGSLIQAPRESGPQNWESAKMKIQWEETDRGEKGWWVSGLYSCSLIPVCPLFHAFHFHVFPLFESLEQAIRRRGRGNPYYGLYMGRLCPKGVPVSSVRYIKG